MNGTDEDLTVATGDWGTVEYAVTGNGETPAREFIEALEPSELRKVAVLFDRMAQEGKINNSEQFKKVSGKIFEFKRHQIRIGCFQIGRTWFLTHGFRKKTTKWAPSQLRRAERIRNEHLAR